MRRGELGVDGLLSVEELAAFYTSLHPDTLRRIARLVRHAQEGGDWNNEIVLTHRKQDGILTNRERDVIILVAHGLIDKEIAEYLWMSGRAARTCLNRVFTKSCQRPWADGTPGEGTAHTRAEEGGWNRSGSLLG